jgi:hypothetical protein
MGIAQSAIHQALLWLATWRAKYLVGLLEDPELKTRMDILALLLDTAYAEIGDIDASFHASDWHGQDRAAEETRLGE